MWPFDSGSHTALYVIDPRVKEGRKSVYGITRKLQKTVFALVSQTDEKKVICQNIAEKYRK